MDQTYDVIVIGAGAAGLLAAAVAAERGRRVLLLEKNRKAGVKILMSGGTRCNLTHAVGPREIAVAFGRQGRFLHSPLAALGPQDVVDLFEAEGVATKVETNGKVFPASDKATDVQAALLRRLRRSGAELQLGEPVVDVLPGWHIVTGRRTIEAAAVVLTTGGASYPGCGTTGDGYAWARGQGHTIVPPRPALVPLTIRGDWAKSLRGVAVPDACVRVMANTELLGERRGAMLFTHFGLSGPAILDVSRAVTLHPRPKSLAIKCDFLPNQSPDILVGHFTQWTATYGKKQVAGLLSDSLPRRLVEALFVEADIPHERRAAELSRHERTALLAAFKSTRFPITGTLGMKKAEVTAGGVPLGEVDSRTMQSKIAPGLFLAGEILDLDGPIGGYNFQAAFSTGYLAGSSV